MGMRIEGTSAGCCYQALHDYRVEKLEQIAMTWNGDDQSVGFNEFQVRVMIVGLRLEISSKRPDGTFMRMSGKVRPIAVCKRWGFKSTTRKALLAELLQFCEDQCINLSGVKALGG